MSDTTNTPDKQACLHLESESIKPDIRVAYAEGLVLGLDEFVQEQRYHLEKDYLHNRSLHGYGTVYGLAVNIAKSQTEAEPDKKKPKPTEVSFASGEKIWLKVGSGVGVDQRGRTFVVPKTYCIDFTNWWNKLINDPKKTQPKITVDKDGQHASIYIRARYDETCGNQVTLAGQACNNGATTSANSRIYDSVYLEPSIEKPVMSAWNLAQRFAWFRSKIHYIPGIKSNDDLITSIESYVRGWLADDGYEKEFEIRIKDWEDPTKPGYIPLPENDQTIEQLQKTYVTDAAPSGYPLNAYAQPTSPSGNDILLAQIDLTGPVSEGQFSTIDKVKLVEDERPYLLSTQTLQELVNIGRRDKNRRCVFASLHVESSTSLFLWVHQPLAKILELPTTLGSNKPPPGVAIGGVVLSSYGTEFAGKIKKITDELYSIDLDPKDKSNRISAGLPVELNFNLDHLTDEQDKPLDTTLFNDFVGLNDDGNVITIYTFADNLAAVHSLATVSARQDDKLGFVLDVGFDRDVTFLTNVTPLWCQIFAHNSELIPKERQIDPGNPRLWHLYLSNPDKENSLLVLRFNTEAIKVGERLLSDLIHDEQINFVGYDGTKFIELAYVVPTLFTRKKVEDIVDERINDKISAAKKDLRDNDIEPLQVLPFATITPILIGETVSFEIWLHPTLTSTNYGDVVTIDTSNLQIKPESAGTVAPSVTFQISPDKVNLNIFTVTITPSTKEDLDIAYLRFVFLTDEITWGGASLKEFRKSHDIRFYGNYFSTDPQYDYIIIYVRNQIMPILKKAPAPIKAKAVAAAEPKVEELAAPTPKVRTTRRAGGKT